MIHCAPKLARPAELLLALTLLTAFAVVTQGQSAARPDRGFMPGASYSISDFESVSLSSGNVNLSIPLASLPPIAGGKLKLTVSAIYNSKLWNITRQENQLGVLKGCPLWTVDTPQLSDLGGWRIDGRYSIQIREGRDDVDYVVPDPLPGSSCETDVTENGLLRNYNWYRVVLVTPDGAEHELRPVDSTNTYPGSRAFLWGHYRDTPQTLNTPMRYYTYDGSFISVVLNPNTYSTHWTINLNDGTRVIRTSDGVDRITDTNGNSIKIFTDTNGTHYQDEQTGREIKYTYDAEGNNNQGQGHVLYQTVGGTWESVDINFGTTLVQGKLYKVNDYNPDGGEQGTGAPCWHHGEVQTELNVIREIVYPVTEPNEDARRFSFSYNSDTTTSATDDAWWQCGAEPESYTRTVSDGMGSLSQVTTPSGATIDYSYSRNGVHNFAPLDHNDNIPRETLTQKEVTHDGITETWTYDIFEFNACGGTVTAPDGSVTVESCNPKDPAFGQSYSAGEFSGLTVRSERSGKERIDRHWTSLVFSGGNMSATGVHAATGNFNPVVDAEYFSLLDGSGNPIKISAKTFQYDYNGSLLSETDYDWFDPASVTFNSQGVPIGVPGSATVLRTTSNTFYNPATSSSSGNVYAQRSLSTGLPLILNALKETTTGPAIAQLSYDGNSYGTAPTVGNLTSKRVWDDVASDWITTSTTYNSSGNVTSATDARGKVTNFYYDDSPYVVPNRVVVDPQNGTGAQTVTTAFDYHTGLVTSQTDVNGKTSTIDYTNQLLSAVDPFGRPGITKSPAVTVGGSSQQHRVTTTYEDHLFRVTVATDLYAENDKLLKTRTTADELGRPVLTEQTEDGTNYTIFSKKVYDSANRISYSSAPMRCTIQSGKDDCGSNPLVHAVTSATDSWTRVTNDILGRMIEVATFAGATQPTATGTTGITGTVTTAYDANFTTVTDQASKVRRSMVDALGRLLRVDEPNDSGSLGTTASPNQPTSYAYDVFGNLLTVTQGSQTRTFTYDSLSRLRTAANPESGTVTYVYDDNGNLLTKTDARSIVSTYVYDALNRATSRSYSDSTPTVTYAYDSTTISNGKGRLASVSSSVSSYSYSGYDAAGKVTGGSQVIGSQTYSLSYGYDLSGHVTSMTYPSGRSVSYNYDNAGRLADKDSTHLAFTGNLGDGATRTYARGISYGPMGQMTQEQFGTTTAVYNKLFYNSRGQLTEVLASTSGNDTTFNRGKIVNDYGTTDNNGNLLKQTVYVPNNDSNSSPTSWYQQYDYDSLNRLSRVREFNSGDTQLWKQSYVFDRYGNRTIDYDNTSSGIPRPQFTVSTSSNRLGVPSGQTGAMSYDSAGNVTTDTYSAGAVTRAYDAENRMISETTYNSVVSGSYSYDGDGRRVKRAVAGPPSSVNEVWQVYGLGGELIAEYPYNTAASSPQKEYGYRNGQMLITATITAAGWGSTPTFTDDPLNSNGTKTDIKLVHLTELRDTVNQLRTHAGLSTFSFTVDPSPVQYQTTAKADHIRQLRTALEQALSALYLPTSGYAHSTLTEQTSIIYAIDFQELRNQIKSAWGNVTINWLVADQLGTPRMIFDQTGSLATISRHDYLPFGEELFAGIASRSTTLGYTNADGARQKFTQKERDNETGLDFFEARYYSSTQGRFTSADDFLNDTHPTDPAGWNLYAYVRNNPLRYVDPTGEKIYVGDITNAADRDEVLRRANYTYGCKDCVTVGKDGFLAVNTTGLSKDVLKATAFLTDAITSNDPNKLFSVQITNNNSEVAFGDSQRGSAGVQLPGNNFRTSAIRIRLDFGDDKRVIGDKEAKEAFLNLVFAHEVAHFVPNFVHDPADGRNTGPVVDAVNEIQQARGLLLRAQYGAFGRGTSGDFVSVEFGRAKTDRAGNIVRNKAGGIEVNRTNKTVTWIKRTVGGIGIN